MHLYLSLGSLLLAASLTQAQTQTLPPSAFVGDWEGIQEVAEAPGAFLAVTVTISLTDGKIAGVLILADKYKDKQGKWHVGKAQKNAILSPEIHGKVLTFEVEPPGLRAGSNRVQFALELKGEDDAIFSRPEALVDSPVRLNRVKREKAPGASG
jgi:hypothetical protein